MDNIAKAGIKLQSYLIEKYGLDKSRLRSDITFSYSENEGEFASFKLNMIYVAKNGNRTPVSIPFAVLGGNSVEGYSISEMDEEYIDHIYNTNCYAQVLGIIGTIDYEMDFIKAIIGDGYRPMRGKAKIGDIMVIGGKHVMIVTGVNAKGELIYSSTNRGAYELMEGTLPEIDEWQFWGSLLSPVGNEREPLVTYYRKQE